MKILTEADKKKRKWKIAGVVVVSGVLVFVYGFEKLTGYKLVKADNPRAERVVGDKELTEEERKLMEQTCETVYNALRIFNGYASESIRLPEVDGEKRLVITWDQMMTAHTLFNLGSVEDFNLIAGYNMSAEETHVKHDDFTIQMYMYYGRATQASGLADLIKHEPSRDLFSKYETLITKYNTTNNRQTKADIVEEIKEEIREDFIRGGSTPYRDYEPGVARFIIRGMIKSLATSLYRGTVHIKEDMMDLLDLADSSLSTQLENLMEESLFDLDKTFTLDARDQAIAEYELLMAEYINKLELAGYYNVGNTNLLVDNPKYFDDNYAGALHPNYRDISGKSHVPSGSSDRVVTDESKIPDNLRTDADRQKTEIEKELEEENKKNKSLADCEEDTSQTAYNLAFNTMKNNPTIDTNDLKTTVLSEEEGSIFDQKAKKWAHISNDWPNYLDNIRKQLGIAWDLAYNDTELYRNPPTPPQQKDEIDLPYDGDVYDGNVEVNTSSTTVKSNRLLRYTVLAAVIRAERDEIINKMNRDKAEIILAGMPKTSTINTYIDFRQSGAANNQQNILPKIKC